MHCISQPTPKINGAGTFQVPVLTDARFEEIKQIAELVSDKPVRDALFQLIQTVEQQRGRP